MNDFQGFLPYVKRECCNYIDSGPGGIAHYCALEPGRTKGVCVMFENIGCKWFRDAVVRRDPALHVDYQRVLLRRAQPGAIPQHVDRGVSLRRCRCGTSFKPTSPRQKLCPECGVVHRRRQARDRKRRERHSAAN